MCHIPAHTGAILHRADAAVPGLADLEQQHKLFLVPSGGSDLWSAFRFAGLQLREFHLLDRDVSPATEVRQQVAAMVNSRAGCRACLTSKRTLENYLHDDSVFEASGIRVVITDEANVPELVARGVYGRSVRSVGSTLPTRSRKRLHNKAKNGSIAWPWNV